MNSPRVLLASFCACAALVARAVPTLTLAQAREMALQTYPRITLAQLRALLAQQRVVEARAGFLPVISANATAVDSGEQVTRIGAGSLSNSQIYDHTGVGATLSLLVTDFGRTANLTRAAREQAKAAEADALATRAQLLMEVDAAFVDALKAKSVQAVAAKTVATRQTLFSRTHALAQNQLKSDLDVRLARVSVDEARLMEDEANKQWQAALTTLGMLIGRKDDLAAVTLEEPPPTTPLPTAVEPLIEAALRQRPELTREQADVKAAQATARAARDARLPTISVAAAAGVIPTSEPHFEHNYAAGGVNVNLPLFAGGMYRARQREAELQADAANAGLQEQVDQVTRDVRLSWLEAEHAQQRIGLTANLLENANAALDLARARFDQGLSSIVELTQAELAQTSAEIAHTSADYDYRIRREMLDYQVGALR